MRLDDKGRWHNRTRRKYFATMRYTISGIPKATVPTHLLYRVEHYVSGLLQLLEFRVCRVPLSPKWATPGLGSDFAISSYVVECNPSITLYLFDPCDSDTDAVITNPHTSNALSTTARRTPPAQPARRRELLPPSWTRAPVGICHNLMRCGAMCGRGYTCTDAITPLDCHNTHTIQSDMHIMKWHAS